MEQQVKKQKQQLLQILSQLKEKKPIIIKNEPTPKEKQQEYQPQQTQSMEIEEIPKPLSLIDYESYIQQIRSFQFTEKEQASNSDICLYTYQDQQETKQFQITQRDFEFLNRDSFLNDTIINFYLKFINNDLFKNKNYHIFSTFLLTQLQSDINFNYSKWVKIDIFSKDLLFFPLHCENHWSLFIVIKPREIRNGKCQIVYLDSLGLVKNQYYQIIQQFLIRELNRKQDQIWFQDEQIEIRQKQIMVLKQTNCCDCGLYLLQYVEIILKNDIEFMQDLENGRFDFLDMFPRDLIKLKRQQIQNLLYSLQRNEKEDFIQNYIYERDMILQNKHNYDIFDYKTFNSILNSRPDLNDPLMIPRFRLEFYLYKQ